jgi:hypothetical protein
LSVRTVLRAGVVVNHTDTPVLSEGKLNGTEYAGDFIRVTVGEQTWEIREDLRVFVRDYQTSRLRPGPSPDPFERFEIQKAKSEALRKC